MTAKELKVFNAFLEKKGFRDEFYLNAINNPADRAMWVKEMDVTLYLQNIPSEGAIQYAFRWGATPEGYELWDLLGHEWRHYKHPVILFINKSTRVI